MDQANTGNLGQAGAGNIESAALASLTRVLPALGLFSYPPLATPPHGPSATDPAAEPERREARAALPPSSPSRMPGRSGSAPVERDVLGRIQRVLEFETMRID